MRSRLTTAARDSKLEPWQREFMLGVARGTVEGGAAEPSSELPGIALRPAAIASIDGDWTEVRPPAGRNSHTAVYDPVRDRMLVFGGYDGSYYNDVWSLSFAGSPAWSQLSSPA